MANIVLTDRGLRALQVTERTDFWDTTLPGFGVRVSPKGHKAFVLMFWQGGRQRRKTLGSFPEISLAEARFRARSTQGRLAEGVNLAAESTGPEGLRFAQLAEEYLELHAQRKKRSWQTDERMIRKDLLPAWGHLPVGMIKKRDVLDLLDGIVHRGAPIAANRTRALISRIFSWGLKRDLVELNPSAGVERPAPENKRDRVLTSPEIRALWEALDLEEPAIAAAIRLLLVTAQRSQEVRLTQWRNIQGGEWLIPADHAKNGREHLVPLSRQALGLLEGCREEGSVLVVPSPRSEGQPLHRTALSHAARRLCKRLGFQFTPHDLRRTASTLMASLGVDERVISEILNHANASVTGIYNRYRYFKEKQAALQMWGDHLEKLLDEGGGAPTQ